MYTRVEIVLLEHRAHMRVFVGNKTGWQGHGGGTGHRGHCGLAGLDFTGSWDLCQVPELDAKAVGQKD